MFTLPAIITAVKFAPVTLSILAYIDPGTGSIVLQAIVASVVGAAIAVKLFWHRLLKFFGLRKGSEDEPKGKKEDKSKML